MHEQCLPRQSKKQQNLISSSIPTTQQPCCELANGFKTGQKQKSFSEIETEIKKLN